MQQTSKKTTFPEQKTTGRIRVNKLIHVLLNDEVDIQLEAIVDRSSFT